MKYPVKVWICTILSAPFLFIICGILSNPQATVSFLENFIGLSAYMILLSFMFSIPSFCLFWLIFDLLEERTIKTYTKKIALGLTGVFLVWTTFLVINIRLFKEKDWASYAFPIGYSIALLFSVFFLKLVNTRNTSSN